MFDPEDVMIEKKSKFCASGSLLVCKMLKTASKLNEITPSLKRQGCACVFNTRHCCKRAHDVAQQVETPGKPTTFRLATN